MNPDRDLALDIAKFELLWPRAYPNATKEETAHARALVEADLIQLGQLHEVAISTVTGMVRESTVGRDFTCGDDGKLVSARTCWNGKVYSAPVTGISAKRANLLVSAYERKQARWYFFRIPRSAYENVLNSSNIEIPFDLDGNPHRINKCKVNYWNYEVPNFESLAGNI